MFYSLEKRPSVKALNPSFGVGKLAQSLARDWNILNGSDREPFVCMAQKDKERYVSELKAYKKGLYTGNSLSVRQIASLINSQIKPNVVIGGSEGDDDGLEVIQTVVGMQQTAPDQSPSSESGEEHDLEQLCEFYQ